mmetsp:Transcript_89107/g.232353  ORF Transcript_89107/g.232353 Transcript_89107/m.232353 type:complete len:405 (+) Transcript_89107:2-1216(+)
MNRPALTRVPLHLCRRLCNGIGPLGRRARECTLLPRGSQLRAERLGRVVHVPSNWIQLRLLELVGHLQLSGGPPMHLVRAVSPPEGAGPGEGHGQEGVLGDAEAAMDLHGPVHNLLGHGGDTCLHEAQEFPRVRVRVAQAVHSIGGLTDEKPGLVDFGATLGDLLHDAAHLCELLAERGPLVGSEAHERQSALTLPDHAHAVMDAARPQPQLRDLEAPALAPEHVRGGDPHVLEEDLHVTLGAVVVGKNLHGSHQGDARRVHGHQDLGLLAVRLLLGARATHQDQDLAIDVGGACDPMLPAVDHVVVSVPLNARPDVRGITARHCRLRHGISGPNLPFQQRHQPLCLLLLCAEARQNLHVARVRARAIAGLRRELRVVGSSHDLAAIGILQIGQTATLDASFLG